MTTNQIAYWNLQESKRTNRAQEELRGHELSEKSRSNRAIESENYRHNKETERHASQRLVVDQQIANNKIIGDLLGSTIKGASTVASKLI